MEKQKKIVNVPEGEMSGKPLTLTEVKNACEIGESITPRGQRINEELSRGLDFIKKYPKSVTFFGSARFNENDEHYKKAYAIAKKIGEELGYAVVTGGGPGIMEAANKGAKEAGTPSLGFGIELPDEQRINPHVVDGTLFYYFFTRKVSLAFSAEAYLFFPGGMGTLDEFFEFVTLVQTKKIAKVPIILVGNDFWKPLDNFIRKELLEEHQSIDESDVEIYTMTEDEDKIIEIIKNAPLREE